jgi:hypothetical protein
VTRDRDDDPTADRHSTATRSGANGTFDRDSTAPQPRPHRDSTAPHLGPPQPRRMLSAPPASGSLARVPRARRFREWKRRRGSSPDQFADSPEPTEEASWWRPTPSSVRTPVRTCSQGGRQQSGRRGEYCDCRVPDRQTTHWVTTPTTRLATKFRVGLNGTGGLVREPNETVESFLLQNLDPSPTHQAERDLRSRQQPARSAGDEGTSERVSDSAVGSLRPTARGSEAPPVVETPGAFTPRRPRPTRPSSPRNSTHRTHVTRASTERTRA